MPATGKILGLHRYSATNEKRLLETKAAFLAKRLGNFLDARKDFRRMSKASRQRLREAKLHQSKKQLRWLILVVVIVFICAGIPTWTYFHTKTNEIAAAATHDPLHPRTLKELLALPPDKIEQCDVGLMNLLCAEELPGAENLNVQDCLKRLDDWTARVKEETQRHEYRFNEHPEQFRNSLGYYRMMMLGTVLAQDLGIQYDPALAEYLESGKAPTHGVFGTDSKNLFIHGLLNGSHYGTCASMPVLVVAIGRRLGYPVNLAGAKLHLYARYEDYNGKHFNIEPTETKGFFTPSDDDYKSGNGRFPATDEEIKGYGWLRPYSNKEALSQFLDSRGVCLGDAKRYDEAREMFIKSASYAPDTPLRRKSLQLYLEEVKDAPLGDKINDWRAEIISWDVPDGLRHNYYENRKIQVRYFVGMCPDANADQNAVDDLKADLDEYRRQMMLTNPAPEFLERGGHLLDLTQGGQELRVAAETLPPPLNTGEIPSDYLHCIASMDLQDEGAILDAFWQHYHDITTNWSNQPPLLIYHWPLPMGINFQN